MRRFFGWLMCALLVFGPWAGRAVSAENAPGGGGVEMVIEPPSPEYEAEQAKRDAAAAAEAKGKGKGKSAKGKTVDSAKAADQLEQAKQTFAEFCAGWVDKLRERERYNQTKIQWEPSSEGGVVGEYVGYDTNHVGPQSVEPVDATPIGKLVYIEVKLRRVGKSKEEALAHDPEIVEKTEVTEIFRFDRGSWVY